MKIDYSHYELTAKNPIQSKMSHSKRYGALLRVTFEEGYVGYADCHPWVELGDASLEEQLAQLKSGVTTPLTRQSIYAAMLDGQARSKEINLFAGLTPCSSHYLIPNILTWNEQEIRSAMQTGFLYYKVKLGANLPLETPPFLELLNLLRENRCKVRIDFNLKLTKETFTAFIEALGDKAKEIDFYEDPFNYEADAWSNIQDKFGIALGCDNKSEQAFGNCSAAKVIVIKTAVQRTPEKDEVKGQRIIFTTYLDHPLGQLFAAYSAAKFQSGEVCGLVSHLAYESNPFSVRLKIHRDQLIPPNGPALGFDDLLEELTWIPL